MNMESKPESALESNEDWGEATAIGTGAVIPENEATIPQGEARTSSSSLSSSSTTTTESRQEENQNTQLQTSSEPISSNNDNIERVSSKDHGNNLTSIKTAENDNTTAARTLTTVSTNSPPYTVFSKNQRKFSIFMSSWAGFFSPVSANIYFPALNSLANDLDVSLTMINLTITSYMIFQGLAPMFIGNFADAAGRRPAYIVTFTIYILANIGLALQNNYAALFVLRCIQSTGSSPTVALSFGVVADVTTSAERGVAMGFATAGSLMGPSLGPVIGGLLSQYLGWRSIFWFLTIFTGAFMVLFIIAVPETGRKIVGNGSIPPQGWNMSLLEWLTVRRRRKAASKEDQASIEEQQQSVQADRPHIGFPNPLPAIRIILQKEGGLILILNAIIFSAFYQVTTAISSQFKIIYGFDDLHIGLCYLPFGVGCSLAALINGKFLDLNYRRLARRHNLVISRNRQQDLRHFPIEKARLEILLPFLYLNCVFMIAYAWVLEFELPLVAPLILSFFIGYCASGCTSVCNNLIVDLHPTAPSTATAANNLLRCLLGAGATALVVPMIDAWGRGWTFTFDALVLVAMSPIVWVIVKWGPKWREEERVKEETAKKKKEAARAGRVEEGVVGVNVGDAEKKEKK